MKMFLFNGGIGDALTQGELTDTYASVLRKGQADLFCIWFFHDQLDY